MPNKIPLVFHNDSNDDYHFVIKELANKFEGQLKCLGENTEKYKSFSIATAEEVTNIDKHGNESVATVFYKMKLLIVKDL